MANILDYLDWRGDIPFSFDSFNLVDAIILAQLSYVPFEGVVPPDCRSSVTIGYAADRYDPEKVEKNLRVFTFEDDISLVKKLAASKRFSDILLTGYVGQTDEKRDMQFAALTIILPDGRRYISFRGTDSTLAGWKEDFDLSLTTRTASQESSVRYLNENFSGTDYRLITGGHSKGGNSAVYASVYCLPEINDRIEKIYDLDGPGFRDEIAYSPEYRYMIPRIVSVVPESSLVGQLLTVNVPHSIVKSSSTGLMQHLIYSWQVLRNDIERAQELSKSSVLINKTVSKWIDGLDDSSRRAFVDTLFDVIGASEASTLNELGRNKLKSYSLIMKALASLEPEHRKMMKDVLLKLAVNGRDVLLSDGVK